jgi:hypothetical protein
VLCKHCVSLQGALSASSARSEDGNEEEDQNFIISRYRCLPHVRLDEMQPIIISVLLELLFFVFVRARIIA